MILRQPTEDEARLLSYLFAQSNLPVSCAANLLVAPMDDGEMGSLRLLLLDHNLEQRFGRDGAACAFDDADGVRVIATLYVDERGAPFELDM